MKKEYVKPVIVFESFSLSTNIAADCDNIVGNQSEGSCAVLGTGGIAIFNDLVHACSTYPPGDSSGDMWDKLCYHVPLEGSKLFNS